MKKLILQNYQSHKDTVIEFAPTLTALTGRSDSGKSAVRRAISSVVHNKPAGNAFIRTGTKKATVTIDDVSYEKTKSSTKYYIAGKKDPFKALRGAVPDEVASALNIGDVNIQGQHDSPFLLDDSPGKVAKRLSELIDLDRPTQALAYIKAKKRHHKSKLDVVNKSIEETEVQLSLLGHVEQADKELAKIERKRAKFEKLRETRTQLYNTYKNAAQAKYELSRIPSTQALQPAKQLVQHYNELQSMKERRIQLQNVVDTIVSLEKVVNKNPTRLIKKAKRLKKLKEKRDKIKTILKNVGSLSSTIVKFDSKIEALQNKKDKLLEETCPLCGRGG